MAKNVQVKERLNKYRYYQHGNFSGFSRKKNNLIGIKYSSYICSAIICDIMQHK